jgi:hypothetical protein
VVGIDPETNPQPLSRTRFVRCPDALYKHITAPRPARLFKGTWCINWLALLSPTYTHYWALNDDVEITSEGWDTKILKIPQGWLGLSDISPEAGWHTNFPVFTVKHLQAFRTLFPWHFWGWGADHWITRTYREVGRTLRLWIDLHHNQADSNRQRLTQLAGPQPPSDRFREAWKARIHSLSA